MVIAIVLLCTDLAINPLMNIPFVPADAAGADFYALGEQAGFHMLIMVLR